MDTARVSVFSISFKGRRCISSISFKIRTDRSKNSFPSGVSAGAGSGAGIAYLSGASYDEVVHTVINAVAIISGMVCDGAKASCAAKIAEAVDAGIIGYYMAKRGQNFDDGDGIVTAGIEATIRNVGRLAKEGMKETNDEIISIMIGS